MWLYGTWIYQNMLNTEWMIWGIVIIILGFNLLSPIFLYYVLAERKMTFPFQKLWNKFKNLDQTTGS